MLQHGLDSFGSGHDVITDSCEHGSEPSGSIKSREILDQLFHGFT
jgi:hypothetical protein